MGRVRRGMDEGGGTHTLHVAHVEAIDGGICAVLRRSTAERVILGSHVT